MNKVFLKGNLGSDVEVREVGGTKVANFRLATNEVYRKKDGEKVEKVEWHNCELWDTAANTAEKILSKGDSVFLEGTIRNESWEKDGAKHYRTKIRVMSFDKLSWKNNGEAPQSESATDGNKEPVGAGVGNGDEIPF